MNKFRPYLISILAVGIISAVFHGLAINNILPWHIAYSDVLGFWEKASQPVAYTDKQIEYPVITGLFIHFIGQLGGGRADYYLWSSFFLILLAIATTLFLYKLAGDKRELIRYWIFAPTMLVFLTFNWDILAIFLVVLAFYLVSKNNNMAAAAMLALGASAKLFPAIYLIPLLMKQENNAEKVKSALSFGITALAANIYFMLANFGNWSYFFRLNGVRNSNPDSIWTIIRFLFRGLTVPQINIISLILFLAVFSYVMWKYKKESFIKLCFAGTLIFLLFNKVFTPQYLLWLLPFFVLLPEFNLTNRFYFLEFSNIFALFFILPWFFIEKNINYIYLSGIFVLVRHFLLANILFRILKRRA